MRRAFNGNYGISRPFGVYDAAYANYPGSRHPGTDYAVPANTPLLAGMTGTVSVFLRSGTTGRGNEVVISNGNKQRKACHLNRVDVKNGQYVQEGQPIGLSGYTGYVVDARGRVGTEGGAHLHDELLIDGNLVDLEKYLKEDDVVIKNREEGKLAYFLIQHRDCTDKDADGLIGKTLADIKKMWVDDPKNNVEWLTNNHRILKYQEIDVALRTEQSQPSDQKLAQIKDIVNR